jgi:hypothetical protein
MTGKSRLRAKLCPVGFGDKLEDYQLTCNYTSDSMNEIDPNETNSNHIGSETEMTDTSICKMPPSGSD